MMQCANPSHVCICHAGENEEVGKAVGRPPIEGRGVRILCMDGGGMKGLSTLKMLREIERCSGKRIHELFDLICGTSTGGILAASLALQQFTLDDCDDIYRWVVPWSKIVRVIK